MSEYVDKLEEAARVNEAAGRQELALQKMDAFTGGIKVASLAMREVLSRKVAVGIITEETAKAIFEGVGDFITSVLDELPEG